MHEPAGNLFANLPPIGAGEAFESLWAAGGTAVERIVSRGHATPPGEWYDQAWDEWVAVLAGAARLRIDGRPDELLMRPGDWVLLRAGVRHRVEWTDPDRDTVWLAVHVRPQVTLG